MTTPLKGSKLEAEAKAAAARNVAANARTCHAYHRTSRASAETILSEGFRDAEGTWMTDQLWTGVWVTIDQPWDLVVGGAPAYHNDPELLAIEIPLELFVEYEWVQEGIGYREALIPASELNRYPRWRAWECVECGRVEREHSPGWRTVTHIRPDNTELIIRVCPRRSHDDPPRRIEAGGRGQGSRQGQPQGQRPGSSTSLPATGSGQRRSAGRGRGRWRSISPSTASPSGSTKPGQALSAGPSTISLVRDR